MPVNSEGRVSEQRAPQNTEADTHNASVQSKDTSRSKGVSRKLRVMGKVAGAFMALKALAGGEVITPAQAQPSTLNEMMHGATPEEMQAANNPAVRGVLERGLQQGKQGGEVKSALDKAKQEEGWLSQVNKFRELGGIKTPQQSNEQPGQRASSQEHDPSLDTLRNLQAQVGKLSDEAVKNKYKTERDAEIIGKSKDPASADKALREYNKQEENARK